MFSPPRSPQLPAPCTSAVFSPRSSPNVLCVVRKRAAIIISRRPFRLRSSKSFFLLGGGKWSGQRSQVPSPLFLFFGLPPSYRESHEYLEYCWHRPDPWFFSNDARTTHRLLLPFRILSTCRQFTRRLGKQGGVWVQKNQTTRIPERDRCCWCRGELRRGEERVLWSMRKIFQVRFHPRSSVFVKHSMIWLRPSNLIAEALELPLK